MAKVLIVDDVPDNVKLLMYDLLDEGYDVVSSYSGPATMDIAAKEQPDVILLDIMMPEMDGIEVCKCLKADPALKHIPVIMVSAKGEEDDIIRGLDAGAQDYVIKPFSFPIVAARVRSAIRLKEANDAVLKKNAELDEFVGIVSHDLQAPLRSIITFSDIFLRELNVELSDQAAKYLDFIIEGASRMRVLIKDLLEFAKLGRTALKYEDVPLQDCISRVRIDLSSEFERTNAELIVNKLPIVRGDFTLFIQLYQNLISNSLKFINPDRKPVIELTAENVDNEIILGVKR